MEVLAQGGGRRAAVDLVDYAPDATPTVCHCTATASDVPSQEYHSESLHRANRNTVRKCGPI